MVLKGVELFSPGGYNKGNIYMRAKIPQPPQPPPRAAFIPLLPENSPPHISSTMLFRLSLKKMFPLFGTWKNPAGMWEIQKFNHHDYNLVWKKIYLVFQRIRSIYVYRKIT